MSKKVASKKYKRQNGVLFFRKAIRIQGQKIEKSFSRKADSERWYLEKKREKELMEGVLSVDKTDISLQEFAGSWLEKRKLNGKPLGSWESDETRIRKYIVPQFGSRELNTISTKEWECFLDGLVADELVAPATRNRIRSIANKMYNDGLRLGAVSNNPVRIIPKLKESMEAWDYWSSTEEIFSYLTEAKNESPSFFIFACLSLNLGTRIGETLAFDHSDFNIDQRRVHIAKIFEETSGLVYRRTKGHKERWLGLNDSVVEALVEYRNSTRFRSPSDPLICNEQGERYFERQIRRTHFRVCAKAKVKTIRIHDLRHTYASYFIMNGGSLAELQALLGHSSPMMALKYAHLAPGYLEKKAGVVSFSIPQQNVVQLRKIK